MTLRSSAADPTYHAALDFYIPFRIWRIGVNNLPRLTRVFQHSVTQHNAMQEFLATNKAYLRTFYVTADAATALAASCGALQTNRNDFYFSATPEANSTNQRLRAAITFNQWLLCYGMLENAHYCTRYTVAMLTRETSELNGQDLRPHNKSIFRTSAVTALLRYLWIESQIKRLRTYILTYRSDGVNMT